jgi:hypothetical protein
VNLMHEEHRRCGELNGAVEDDCLWMTCECGARMAQPLPTVEEPV